MMDERRECAICHEMFVCKGGDDPVCDDCFYKPEMTIDERWCLPASGYETGSYDLVVKHLSKVERVVCKLAESYAEDRTDAGPINVTCDDVRRAIQEYEL